MKAPAVIANGQARGTALGDRGDLNKECPSSRLMPLARFRGLTCGDNEGIIFDPDGFNLRRKLELVPIVW